MKGHTIFICVSDDCPVITFVQWSNEVDIPSRSTCPCCLGHASAVKAISNKVTL